MPEGTARVQSMPVRTATTTRGWPSSTSASLYVHPTCHIHAEPVQNRNHVKLQDSNRRILQKVCLETSGAGRPKLNERNFWRAAVHLHARRVRIRRDWHDEELRPDRVSAADQSTGAIRDW